MKSFSPSRQKPTVFAELVVIPISSKVGFELILLDGALKQLGLPSLNQFKNPTALIILLKGVFLSISSSSDRISNNSASVNFV